MDTNKIVPARKQVPGSDPNLNLWISMSIFLPLAFFNYKLKHFKLSGVLPRRG